MFYDNKEEFINNLKKQHNNIYRGIQIGLHKSLVEIKNQLILNSKMKKSGKVYKITNGKRTKIHIASSPSETYANITGKTNKSIIHKVSGLTGKIGSNIEYPKFVEYGTKNMSKRYSFNKIGNQAMKNGVVLKNIAEGIKLKNDNL